MDDEKWVNMVEDNSNDFAKDVWRTFRERWKTTYDYVPSKDLLQYKEKEPDQLNESNEHLSFFLTYVTKISFYAMYDKESYKGGLDMKEAEDWNDRGGLCIYASVLLYCLLTATGTDIRKLKYIQGYYHYDFPHDSLEKTLFSEGVYGLHTFLELDGCIIDTTIQQLQDYYQNKSDFYIVGKFLKGLNYFGFEEQRQIIIEYASEISQKRKMTVDEWIYFHIKEANNLSQYEINKK